MLCVSGWNFLFLFLTISRGEMKGRFLLHDINQHVEKNTDKVTIEIDSFEVLYKFGLVPDTTQGRTICKSTSFSSRDSFNNFWFAKAIGRTAFNFAISGEIGRIEESHITYSFKVNSQWSTCKICMPWKELYDTVTSLLSPVKLKSKSALATASCKCAHSCTNHL
jgi:hypothetical protein